MSSPNLIAEDMMSWRNGIDPMHFTGMIGLLFVSTAALAAQPATQCERPVCLPGARWNGMQCQFELAQPGGGTYSASCRDGETLDAARGVCVLANCKGTSSVSSTPKPVTAPIVRAAPIAGQPAATVVPQAAPASAGPPATVNPGPDLTLQRDELHASDSYCADGANSSPAFYFGVRNNSPVSTGVPVVIRVADSQLPEFRADTTIPPIGPFGVGHILRMHIPFPPGLRLGTDELMRVFIVTVDPDNRLRDPDLRGNSMRVTRFLIICRR